MVRPVGPVTLRRASFEDGELLFRWVNAPDSLAQKEQTRGAIQWDEHCTWLKQSLADPGCIIYIVELAGEPVGQTRLQRKGNSHELDIYVSPGARRSQVASQAIVAALRDAGLAHAVARVKVGNTASRRLFEGCQFTEQRREGDIIILVYTAPGLRHEDTAHDGP